MTLDRCVTPGCNGPARCLHPGCEAVHPNACGVSLPDWRCPAHATPQLADALCAALTAWVAKLERRARNGDEVFGESLRFSVKHDAEKDDDGAPYLHVVITARTDTDVEGRL